SESPLRRRSDNATGRRLASARTSAANHSRVLSTAKVHVHARDARPYLLSAGYGPSVHNGRAPRTRFERATEKKPPDARLWNGAAPRLRSRRTLRAGGAPAGLAPLRAIAPDRFRRGLARSNLARGGSQDQRIPLPRWRARRPADQLDLVALGVPQVVVVIQRQRLQVRAPAHLERRQVRDRVAVRPRLVARAGR